MNATTPRQRIDNMLHWLNHQANIHQSRSKKKRTQFAPCPRALAAIEAVRGENRDVAALWKAESAVRLTPCTCHPFISTRIDDSHMLDLEFTAAPAAGEVAGVAWWGKHGETLPR